MWLRVVYFAFRVTASVADEGGDMGADEEEGEGDEEEVPPPPAAAAAAEAASCLSLAALEVSEWRKKVLGAAKATATCSTTAPH